MAGGGRTLKLTILGDAKSGQKAFKDIEASAGGFSSKLGNLFSVAGGFAVFTAGSAAVRGLTGAIKDSIDAAGESAQVQAQTEAVLKSTGGAAGVTADQIGDLATQLSGVAPIDDEVIQSGENMLLTFTNVKNGVGEGNDIFNQATQTLLDMSTAMGTAPKDAAIQLGKALNDPIKGISALSRVGVTFTDQQKDQIKALVESGQTMEAQKIILGELNKEFGGSAEAAGKTLPGQLAILKTALGNVQETIGAALLPVLIRLAQFAVPLVTKSIALLSVWLPRITDMLSGPLSSAFTKVMGIMQRVAGGVRTLIAAFQQGGFSEVLLTIGQALLSAFENIDWGAVASTLRSGLTTALATLANLGGQDLGFAQHLLTMLISAISGIDWGQVGSSILAGLNSAFSTITSTATSLAGPLLTMLVSTFQSIDWASLGATILSGLGTAFSAIASGAGAAVSFGQQLATMIQQQAATVDWSGVAGAIQIGLGNAMNAAGSAAGAANGATGGLLGSMLGDVASVVGRLQPIFAGVMAALTPLITNLSTTFAPVIAQLQASWAQLQPTIASLQVSFQNLQPILVALAAVIGGTLAVAVGLMVAGLGGAVNMLAGVLPGAIQVATGVIQVISGDIEVFSSLIGGTIKVITDLLHGDWSQAWADAKAAVQGMADGIVQIFTGLGNIVNGLISALVGGVEGYITGFVSTIIGYFQGLYDALVGHSIIPDMIAGIVAAFAGMPGQIIGIVSGFIAQILGLFSDLATQMLSKGGEIVSNLAGGISGGIGAVLGAVGNVVSGIRGAFSGAGSWLADAGGQIIMGLAGGIGNMAGAAVSAAENVAHSIVHGVKSALGIQSPSTVMIEVGHNILAGLAQGLDDINPVSQAADSAASEVVNALIKGIVGAGFDKEVGKLSEDMLPALMKAQEEAQKALNLGELAGVSGDELKTLQDNLFAATILITRWSNDNQETVAEFRQKALDAAKAEDAQQAIISSWTDTFSNFDAIVGGTFIPQLQDKLAGLKGQLQVALAEHLPQTIIDGIQTSITTVTQQIQQAGQVVKDATDAGIIQPVKALSDDAVAKIKDTMKDLKDGGASLIDSIVSGVESGKIQLNQAMQLIPDSALPKLKDVIDTLKEKLADALIEGTDPGPIQANLQTLTQLFAALQAAASQSADAIKQVAVAIGDYVEGKGYKTAYGYSNVKPGASSSAGGSGGGGGSSSSGLPNGTPANLQHYYDTYYTPDELTTKTVNGKAITVPKKDVRASQTASSTTNIHGDIYVTQQQPTSLDDLLRGLSTA